MPDAFANYVASVHRAVHALGLYFDRAMDGQTTQAEGVVLLHLARAGESTINDVHRAFLHKRSTLTSVVDRLEDKGLVRRRIGEADRRNFALVLTPQGAKAATRVLQAVAALQDAVAAAPSHVDTATALLEKTASACGAFGRDAARTARRS